MTSLKPNFHFISGLPRSGSTLTAALLRQNPRFHAGMSSPVAGLFEGVISQVSAGSEMASMVNEEQRERILKGIFESYYADRDEPVRRNLCASSVMLLGSWILWNANFRITLLRIRGFFLIPIRGRRFTLGQRVWRAPIVS